MEVVMASSRQIEEIAAAWLARRDAGSWSEKDRSELDAWLEESTAHRVAFLRLEAAWRQSDRLKALGAGVPAGVVPARGAWGMSASEESAPSPPSRTRSLPAAALLSTAAAFALVIIGVLALGWHRYVATEQASYRTTIGAIRDVQLSDGTQITLSSNSWVLVTYSYRKRLIELKQGEAFFKVAKDSDRPFVVRAGQRSAIAVGTRYGVRRDDGNLRVVVTEGVVRLETDVRTRPTTLLPAGSIALASDAGVMVRSGSVQQAEELLDWRLGFITFHDTPLASAVAEFNRYNAGKIVIGDASIGALLIGGNFKWSNSEAFVRLLEQAFPIRASRNGDTIVLTRR
jgi:transmembrane sensor